MPYAGYDAPVAELSIASIQGQFARCAPDIYFFLILSGEVEFHCGETATHATLHDVVMFAAGEAFTAHAAGNNLVLIVSLRGDFFKQGQSALLGSFICNSATDAERDYATIRRLLAQLALVRTENTLLSDIHERELAYSLVYYLNRYHYVPHTSLPGGKIAQKYAERTAQIHSYIEQNYRRSVSLSDLAQRMYLTPAYLSRFIRQQLGMSFTELLGGVRLKHAVFELLHTELPITTIAYNNGFSSLGSFNHIFREAYALPPGRYRQQHLAAEPSPASDTVKPRDYTLAERTLSGLASYGEAAASAIRLPGQEVCHVADVGLSAPVIPIWGTLINIGYSSHLNNSNLQAHLAMAQKEIGFDYGRIQSVLNDELLPPLPGSDGYNYSEFDRFIEWMLSINLRPFLDLTYQQSYLLLDSTSIVYSPSERGPGAAAGTQRQFYKKVSALIRHCINTFGVAEVERWGFEIGYTHNEYLVLTETPAAFAQRFARAYRIVKELLPGAAVGGMHHNVSIAPELFEQIVTEMERIGFSPDFISLCGFPYERSAGSAQQPYVYSSDPSFALHKIAAVKEILAQHDSMTQRLCLTVFGTDVKTRNPLSDSCFQSAFLVKNTIDLLGMVEIFGYWQLSDIATEYVDAARMLFGGTGLLSKHGLKKPGFTALKRMNYLPAQLIQKGDGYLVATNTRNTYNVVVCNYAHYSDVFCVGDAASLPIEEVYSSFSDPFTKDMTIELGRMPAGRYKVITTSLNRENGSLLDEWIRYGILDDLQPRDIHYFRDIVHPQRLARYIDCENGMLTLHAQLLPHEVKFFEIIREL